MQHKYYITAWLLSIWSRIDIIHFMRYTLTSMSGKKSNAIYLTCYVLWFWVTDSILPCVFYVVVYHQVNTMANTAAKKTLSNQILQQTPQNLQVANISGLFWTVACANHSPNPCWFDGDMMTWIYQFYGRGHISLTHIRIFIKTNQRIDFTVQN